LDYHAFGFLKCSVCRHFATDHALKKAVHTWLDAQEKEKEKAFPEGIKLIQRWTKCVEIRTTMLKNDAFVTYVL
jgi:hypothetical protein